MFSLICVWINGWVNNGEAGDLRRYRAHYDVILMNPLSCVWVWLASSIGQPLFALDRVVFALFPEISYSRKCIWIRRLRNGSRFVSASNVKIAFVFSKGWRWTHYISGFAGILLGTIFLVTIKEPERKQTKSKQDARISRLLGGKDVTWYRKVGVILRSFANPSLIIVSIAGSVRNAGMYFNVCLSKLKRMLTLYWQLPVQAASKVSSKWHTNLV